MHLGYDAKRFFLNRTGLGNYSRWLLKSLADHYPENGYYLYTPKTGQKTLAGWLQSYKQLLVKLPESARFMSWWRTKGIVKDLQRDGVELYHGLSHELPLGIKKTGVKSVVTVHDLIVLRYPRYFGLLSRAIYKAKLKYACRVADKIIAVSQNTKDDLIELLNVPADKITVVYQGCDESFKTAHADEVKRAVLLKYQITGDYILSVGTIEERKNLLLLIKALPKVSNKISLIVIGRHTVYAKQVTQKIKELHLENQVKFLTAVDFADLPALYQSAKLFVYPSRYEGFGIPVLEALYSGTPVIAASGSCLEEAGGPGSLYVGADDANGLAEKINRVLNDPSLQKEMRKSGQEYSANFDDEKLASEMMAVYQQVLSEPGI